jgi:hypothetical protein
LFVVLAADAQGFGDGLTDFLVGDSQGLLKLSFNDVL